MGYEYKVGKWIFEIISNDLVILMLIKWII